MEALTDLTVNYGLRFDGLNAYLDEYQLARGSMRFISRFKQTALHVGYARYFTPPPHYLVPPVSIAKFDNTTFGANPDNEREFAG